MMTASNAKIRRSGPSDGAERGADAEEDARDGDGGERHGHGDPRTACRLSIPMSWAVRRSSEVARSERPSRVRRISELETDEEDDARRRT